MKGVGKKQEKRLKEATNYYLTNEITITDCAIKYGCDRHALSKWIKRAGGVTNPHGKQSINSNIFNIIDTEEKAYWLGFLYADGCVYGENFVSLELALKDEKHLLKYHNFLKKEKPLRKDHFRVRCVFQDKQIYEDLNKLGVVPRKSLILTFPTYKQVPKHLIRHFIRGYIDGDGSIYLQKYQNNNINISILGTKEFLNSLIQEMNSPIRKLYVNNKNNDSNCYFFQYSGENCLNILNYLYKNANVYLERKYNKYLEYCRLRGEIPQIITAELSKEGEIPNLN